MDLERVGPAQRQVAQPRRLALGPDGLMERQCFTERRPVKAILSRALFILTGFLKPIVTGVDTGVVCRSIDMYPIGFVNAPAIARRRAYGKSADGLDPKVCSVPFGSFTRRLR